MNTPNFEGYETFLDQLGQSYPPSEDALKLPADKWEDMPKDEDDWEE